MREHVDSDRSPWGRSPLCLLCCKTKGGIKLGRERVKRGRVQSFSKKRKRKAALWRCDKTKCIWRKIFPAKAKAGYWYSITDFFGNKAALDVFGIVLELYQCTTHSDHGFTSVLREFKVKMHLFSKRSAFSGYAAQKQNLICTMRISEFFTSKW